MMTIDVNQDNDDEDDNDRTELYTPPPLDTTNELNSNDEKENSNNNNTNNDRKSINQQSFIAIHDSLDQETNTKDIDYYPSNLFIILILLIIISPFLS